MQHTLTSLVKEASGLSFGQLPSLTADPYASTNRTVFETPYLHGRVPLADQAHLGPVADANYAVGHNLFMYPGTGAPSDVFIRPSTAKGRAIAATQANSREGRDLQHSFPDFGAEYNLDPTSSIRPPAHEDGFDWSRLLGPGVGALGGLAAGRIASGFMDDDEDDEDPRERARARAANSRRKLMLGLLGAGLGGYGGYRLQNS